MSTIDWPDDGERLEPSITVTDQKERIPMAKKPLTPYQMAHPAGFPVTVHGEPRRDVFLARGYTLVGGAPASDEPKTLADHTMPELEAIAAELEVSKAGPKAALVARIEEAYAAKAEDGGAADEGDEPGT
jgi:hypothetical protein